MFESMKAGKQLDLPSNPTLSDGTAGGVEVGSITFALCQEIIDEFILVDEEAISEGVRVGIEKLHQLIEGAAGAAIAGFLQKKDDLKGQTVVIIICGGTLIGEEVVSCTGSRSTELTDKKIIDSIHQIGFEVEERDNFYQTVCMH